MKNLKLKVCGLRDRTNILEVADLQPDYMGFIFYPGSKRYVGRDFSIPEEIAVSIRKVGVFVNQPLEEMLDVARSNKLDAVQLHGTESANVCNDIKKAGFGVIKAFRMDGDFDFSEVVPYRKAADYFLFDAKGKYYGGNGVTFDWSQLKDYDQSVPFFLSGGISPDDAEAIQGLTHMNLHAIDVNSRVEKDIGIKDVSLIRKFDNVLYNWSDI